MNTLRLQEVTNKNTNSFFQTDASSTPSKKSPDPDTVQHHRPPWFLNISMLYTVYWHFPGNISRNICFNFPVFTHCYLKPPMCELASITWSQKKKKGNVEQAKTLKLNLDSSRRKCSKHCHVSCWFRVTCNQLVFSFSSFFLTRTCKQNRLVRTIEPWLLWA